MCVCVCVCLNAYSVHWKSYLILNYPPSLSLSLKIKKEEHAQLVVIFTLDRKKKIPHNIFQQYCILARKSGLLRLIF